MTKNARTSGCGLKKVLRFWYNYPLSRPILPDDLDVKMGQFFSNKRLVFENGRVRRQQEDDPERIRDGQVSKVNLSFINKLKDSQSELGPVNRWVFASNDFWNIFTKSSTMPQYEFTGRTKQMIDQQNRNIL